MVAKLVLLHVLGILLLITKTNAITVSETSVLEVTRKDHVNLTDEARQNETFVEEITIKSSESVSENSMPKQNGSAECKQIFYCESRYNIHVIYTYYNRGFQVILLILFGIELKLTKIKAVFRNPIGPGIASFCCWILAPLVSGNFMPTQHTDFY